ncbi:MAG: carbamoyl-phosphate synthase large subunit [Deltaproteobacteria bacterium]|nr:carbamoyl-phosphate synthase large subunit [Deltaproteobacteria bacterium]MBW1870996.1 carbamoyl-phosphate synthase large subunit [Deltaproteobacteria bacterium]
MPRRDDIRKILIIGSGPIVIGQACEFDYSGTQAARALKEEGYEVVLVNSNPATIMTDPEIADRTYIEPLTVSTVAKIIERERPDALLPTVGGQTALNLSVKLAETGILKESGTRLIGARLETIRVAEDRRLFRAAMEAEGLDVPSSFLASSVDVAVSQVAEIGYPVVIRPSFTLGGEGGGVAYNVEELRESVARGIDASPIGEVLVEEGVLGWKEFELEVMRDCRDRFVVICSIENVDPMGVHTGDSVTVAPAMTLSDVEFQKMRDLAKRVIQRVGVETGGSNIQFAVDPETGRMVIIEMNPRVSRSSALASKATGFPIAKIAAKLAVGLTLDEIENDITRETPASFEPSLDYVVVKIPRFTFKKFPGADDTLDTQMRSVGEAMAIGRTFQQALQKALRSLEIGRAGLGADGQDWIDPNRIHEHLVRAHPARLFWVRGALLAGMTVEQVHRASRIDPWFLHQILDLTKLEKEIEEADKPLPETLLRRAKRAGFADAQLAYLTKSTEEQVAKHRRSKKIVPTYKTVDTCAAEFAAETPYYYATYEDEDEVIPSDNTKVMILGGGPNRIGQGIEFDCCCVHATQALREDGYETIMVNCNPETVSTDYDLSDRLYFEPLTAEDVLEIVHREQPHGLIVQFGGATPLSLAGPLSEAGVNILGTSPEAIDLAEDRVRFGALLDKLGIARPDYGTAETLEQARQVAERIGYPVLVRPSYVLGGRAMAVCYDDSRLAEYLENAVKVARGKSILIDRFLEDAFEVDVDALADVHQVVVCGIMQHLEKAGIHSGDSIAVLPTWKIKQEHLQTIRSHTRALGMELGVCGLMNVQYAIFEDKVYVLEVNPRASRTIPFLSKACRIPFAKLAARIMLGRTLEELEFTKEPVPDGFAVKVPVFPFDRFAGFDPVLGPEMRSTGEAYGADSEFGLAFVKGMMSAGQTLPVHGVVCISVNDRDKDEVIPIARDFADLGFSLVATRGTAEHLAHEGLQVEMVYKVNEGRPHIADRIHNSEIDLMINTPLGASSHYDERALRRAAIIYRVPIITTLSAARAAVEGIRRLGKNVLSVNALQQGPTKRA